MLLELHKFEKFHVCQLWLCNSVCESRNPSFQENEALILIHTLLKLSLSNYRILHVI